MRAKVSVSLLLMLFLGWVGTAVDLGGTVSGLAIAQVVGTDPITVYPLGFSSTPATGTITCVAGSSITNGSTISFTNANGNSFTYQFTLGTVVTPPNIAVPFNRNMSAADVAQAVAAQLVPRFVNGDWAGPRITFSVSGDTLSLTQGRSGTAGNNLIAGTAQFDGFVFTGFAGGVTDDRVNIQAAFNSVAPGGTVLLKATALNGNPTAFDLGQFEYFLYVPPTLQMNSRSQPNISNHRVTIDKAMTVQGETVGGYTTTIKNGFMAFAIGLNFIPTWPGPISIDGIHFQDAGLVTIYAEQSPIPLTITHNTITTHLADRFAGTAKPGWDSSLANNWGNPEDGSHITMVQFDANGQTFTDVTASYTKAERLAAFQAAAASMFFDPRAVSTTDGSGQTVPYYGSWEAIGIGLINAYGPLGLLGVPFTINDNDITQNANLPSGQFTPVWYEANGILTQGHRLSASNIVGNAIHNVSSGGIWVLDDTGTVTIQGNLVEVGPAGSYFGPQALTPPRTSATAIAAVYNALDVYQYPPNVPVTYPLIGGDVRIVNNTITNSSPYAKDAGGITVSGENASFFNSVAIEGNLLHLTNGSHGIAIAATDVPGASGPMVSQNTLTGSGFSGLSLGLTPGIPKDAANIVVTDYDLSGYSATSAGTSFPHLPAAYVYLWNDTHHNGGTKICVPADTTYSAFIRDLGTDNDFQPSCSAIAMTGYLIEKVEHLDLRQGIENSLEAKLSNVLASLTAANAEHRQDATRKLNAFINECEAQSGKALTVDQAGELIAVAKDIIATLTPRH